MTAKRIALSWSDIETIYDWDWELYVLYWSEELNLLFINSSANAGEYKSLARAVAGEDVTLITGQQVFRPFAGITRLRLQNVGLSEQLGRNVRYTGRMGADVESALTEVLRRKGRKSVLAGGGFEDGHRATIGASRRGRIWSHQRENVAEFVAWCEHIGRKLLDDSIDPDEVLKGTLNAKTISVRPNVMPISVDWPEEIYKNPESFWTVRINGTDYSLGALSIELVDPAEAGPLRIAISSESESVVLTLDIFENDETPNYAFRVEQEEEVTIRRGGRSEPYPLTTFFYDEPPIIWFVNGSSLEGNEYVELKALQPPYDRDKIQAWDWGETDLRKESQGPEKDPASVQAHVIRRLQTDDTYSIIFDDDGKGELADVVAIRLIGDVDAPSLIELELYHCKYSKADDAGARVGDLYEVCGQAQKCISWLASPERQTDMLTHLLRREASWHERELTRIERGSWEELLRIREISRQRTIRVKVFIVQPGVSKADASRDQLELLSVTENHLMETYQLPLVIITSA